MQEKKEMS